MPRAMPNMPSVAMKGGTLSRAMRTPLTRPATQAAIRPTAAPLSKATHIGVVSGNEFMTVAAITAAMPMTQPAERSMPPEMMT